jgi:hypothetical protein
MKSEALIVIALAAIPWSVTVAEEQPRGRLTGQFELVLVNPEGCPIQVLDKKTRVADPNRYDAWAPVRSNDPSTYARKSYESGERQMIYDVAFRNDSKRNIVSVEFLWEAFDTSKRPSFNYRAIWDAKTLRPGEVQFKHEVDFKLSADIGGYRLSVRKVRFDDGEEWVAPPPSYE